MEKETSAFEIYDGSGSKPVSIEMGISPLTVSAEK